MVERLFQSQSYEYAKSPPVHIVIRTRDRVVLSTLIYQSSTRLYIHQYHQIQLCILIWVLSSLLVRDIRVSGLLCTLIDKYVHFAFPGLHALQRPLRHVACTCACAWKPRHTGFANSVQSRRSIQLRAEQWEKSPGKMIFTNV